MERKLITKIDILIICSVLLIIAVILSVRFFGSENEKIIAEVYFDGNLIDMVNLTNEEEKRIVTGQNNDVVIVAENGKIFFEESSCHDRLCVLGGELDSNGDFSACLPEKVIVKVLGEKKTDEPDAIVY